jgi:hypothetical protein
VAARTKFLQDGDILGSELVFGNGEAVRSERRRVSRGPRQSRCALIQTSSSYDLDLPIECDDEYWDHPDPEMRFKQPPGMPSKVSSFVHILKLKQIQLRAIRSLVSGYPSPVMRAACNFRLRALSQFPATSVLAKKRFETVPDALANIDSAMNEWADSIPKHRGSLFCAVCCAEPLSVVWDPVTHQNSASELFFTQSAQLMLLWNHLRIMIHRPFVAVHKPTAASATSHAQCTHAARANARILGTCMQRAGSNPPFMTHMLVRFSPAHTDTTADVDVGDHGAQRRDCSFAQSLGGTKNADSCRHRANSCRRRKLSQHSPRLSGRVRSYAVIVIITV